MEIIEILLIVILCYAGFVVLMEVLIGYIQPEMDGGVTLTTTDAQGKTSVRCLYGAKMEGKLYVSSNHWVRGWYKNALVNSSVLIEMNGVQVSHTAAQPDRLELARITDAYKIGFVLRFICGFAPRKFLRLDPI